MSHDSELREHKKISEQVGIKRVVAYNDDGEPITPINSLVEVLQELIQRLAPLAGAMTNAAQLRIAGTVTATGGGYITSAQSIAEKNVAGVSYTTRTATENLNAVMSNINNVVIGS
jgi:hypothetical protein